VTGGAGGPSGAGCMGARRMQVGACGGRATLGGLAGRGRASALHAADSGHRREAGKVDQNRTTSFQGTRLPKVLRFLHPYLHCRCPSQSSSIASW
jgi:hypothetical protein